MREAKLSVREEVVKIKCLEEKEIQGRSFEWVFEEYIIIKYEHRCKSNGLL